MDVIIVLGGLALVAMAAYFVANLVYRRMAPGGRRAAIAVSILTFLASAFVIGWTVIWLILSNMRFER